LLEVRGLSSGYGEVPVLWDVSIEVSAGEVVALIGANGAGKTTLLATISQLLSPWAGSIRFGARDLTHAGSAEVVSAGLVHVPQGRRLFAGLTVEDNLLQGAYLVRDRSAVRKRLDWVLSIFPRLAERRHQATGLLSGGEQQMCAIGRGLMSQPRLLMIDELSLGLSPLVVDTLVDLLSALNRDGMTILLVEQDVQVALEHAHRGYVLEAGRVVKAGPAADLLGDSEVRRAYLGL
jgi:branched-chain amino acid transport system ATP-binding protein